MDLGHQWPSRLTLSEKIHSWLSLHHPVCLRIQHKWFKINVFIADLRLSGFTYTLIFQTIVRGNFEIKNHRKNVMTCDDTRWHVMTRDHMHEILRWPEIWTIQFLFNFCSNHRSRAKILRWKIRAEPLLPRIPFFRILIHLRIFELKKVSHLRILTRDWYFELKLKRIWMIRILSHEMVPV